MARYQFKNPGPLTIQNYGAHFSELLNVLECHSRVAYHSLSRPSAVVERPHIEQNVAVIKHDDLDLTKTNPQIGAGNFVYVKIDNKLYEGRISNATQAGIEATFPEDFFHNSTVATVSQWCWTSNVPSTNELARRLIILFLGDYSVFGCLTGMTSEYFHRDFDRTNQMPNLNYQFKCIFFSNVVSQRDVLELANAIKSIQTSNEHADEKHFVTLENHHQQEHQISKRFP